MRKKIIEIHVKSYDEIKKDLLDEMHKNEALRVRMKEALRIVNELDCKWDREDIVKRLVETLTVA